MTRRVWVFALVAAALLAAGLPSFASAGERAAATTTRKSVTVSEQRMLTLINRTRVRHNLRPLRYSATMSAQARPWARHLATPGWHGRLAHKVSYWQQTQTACRGESAGAENVAARLETGRRAAVARRAARGLLRQYRNSPPHRANLMNPSATHVAVATVMRRTSSGHWYAANVLRFARASSC